MRKNVLVVLVVMLIAGLIAGCSSKADEARESLLKEIDHIKVSDYMEEDQEAIKDMIKSVKAEAKKADEKELKKLSDSLKKGLKAVETKAQKIEAFKKELSKLTEGMSETDKKKAEEILNEIEYKGVNSIKDLENIMNNVSEQLKGISSSVAEKVEAAKAEIKNKVETDVKAAKEAVKAVQNRTSNKVATSGKTSSSSSSNAQSTSSGNTSSAPSASSSSNASSSNTSSSNATPEKKKVWVEPVYGTRKVLVKEAWTEEFRQPVKVDAWWINFKDGTQKWYYDKSEWRNAYSGNSSVARYGGPKVVNDPTGKTYVYDTEYHPAEYRTETYIIKEGYWKYE